jgi:hypothetical protein
LDGALLAIMGTVLLILNLINAVVNVIWRKIMAKMASLHAEGYTDEDLEQAALAEILDEIFID